MNDAVASRPKMGRKFNEALWLIRTGRCRNIAEIDSQLAEITGLSLDAIRGRSERIEYNQRRPDDVLAPDLDAETRAYLDVHYAKSKDPAVRQWLQSKGVRVTNRP